MASGSKNNPTNKKEPSKNVLVTSEVCEKCQDKCDKGIQYCRSIIGNFGQGIVCHKLKSK